MVIVLRGLQFGLKQNHAVCLQTPRRNFSFCNIATCEQSAHVIKWYNIKTNYSGF